jgi:hypothetical protein
MTIATARPPPGVHDARPAANSESILSDPQNGRTAPLAHRVGRDADAAQVAEAMAATWREIDAALAPVIGRGGVAALYKRSVHLTRTAHPWVDTLLGGVQGGMDLAALRSLFAAQGSAEACACGNDLLQTFYQLLGSLIGASLTERLLRSVWATSSSGTPAQDTPQ